MTKDELLKAIDDLKVAPDEQIKFIGKSGKEYDFWDQHEWCVCLKRYAEHRRTYSYLAILIDD